AKATSEESMLWHRRLGHVNFKNINKLVKENLIENLVDKKGKIIRSDNGTAFKNNAMGEFCREKGIKREYSVARIPQQNGVDERKNKTLIEAARTMLADSKLPTTFWAEAVSTACYVQNMVLNAPCFYNEALASPEQTAPSKDLSNPFIRSAEASTDDNGEGKINATVDGHSLSITEGSLRRHLKLADQDGVTS
ncbi:ribonuclease H-like domain-containing protein, partial [Tanacetum coccineum]